MKKTLCAVIISAFAITFVACSGDSQEKETKSVSENTNITQSVSFERGSSEESTTYSVRDFSIQIPESWAYDNGDINDYYIYKDGAFLSTNFVDLTNSEDLDLKSFMTIYVDTLEKSKHLIVSKDLIKLPNTEAYKIISMVDTNDKQLNYQTYIVKSAYSASIFNFIQSETIDEDFNKQIERIVNTITPIDGVNELQDSCTPEDDLKEVENRAKEIASNLKSFPITEGDMFDQIKQIYKNVDIHETREESTNKPYTLSIQYQTQGGDIALASAKFMDFVEASYEAINFENSEYKNIAYDFRSDDVAVCMLFITKEDDGKATTSGPVIMNDNYRETIEKEYSSRVFFTSKDILENFKNDLTQIENSIR